MKFATMATGGIGGYLAVKLAQSGHDVATIARGAHLSAIRENGLRLDSPEGPDTVSPWKATDDPVEVGPVDAIIFGVKGDALPHAAEACRPMLGPQTVVIPYLNGVEASDRLASILPAGHVANGLAQVSTTISEPGVIKQTGIFNKFVFAERDSVPSDRISRIQAALEGAGVSAPETDDIERDLWMKFVLFSAVSGVTAAGRCTIADILTYVPLTDLFHKVVAETAALARAKGIAIPDTAEADTWAMAQTLPPPMRASTAIDVEAGRPLEIEWISGAAHRLGQELGVPTPSNSALYALLLPHKNGH